ncbi:MAG TPA: ISNCY family transposase [Candidatus Deferrimicrobiaceae bacterium]
MRPAEWLQEVRMKRFREVYGGWRERRLSQEEAARILGVSGRTFRRYVEKYDDGGMEALVDKRLSQVAHNKAPVDEILALTERYRARHDGWTAQHFHAWYKRSGGTRSYTWTKTRLQEARLVKKAPRRGVHRKRRERAPWPGLMIHQDGSTHEWIPGEKWDLILTMDDATNEHYSMFFVDEEGTQSSFRGIGEIIRGKGLFSSFYSDRGSHYWHTPEAGKRVDKKLLTQFGRAMKQLGIEMIPAYSPEARGRIERAFRTHQDRLPKELALHGITEMEEANRYIRQTYLPAHNAEFCQPPLEEGTAFVECVVPNLDDILCEQHERSVGRDNCVSFDGKKLQIPADRHRCHYIKATVRVHRYQDNTMAVFYGPRKLASYDAGGILIGNGKAKASA